MVFIYHVIKTAHLQNLALILGQQYSLMEGTDCLGTQHLHDVCKYEGALQCLEKMLFMKKFLSIGYMFWHQKKKTLYFSFPLFQ